MLIYNTYHDITSVVAIILQEKRNVKFAQENGVDNADVTNPRKITTNLMRSTVWTRDFRFPSFQFGVLIPVYGVSGGVVFSVGIKFAIFSICGPLCCMYIVCKDRNNHVY